MTNLTIMEALLFMQNPIYLNFSNLVLINYHDQKAPSLVQGIRLYDSGSFSFISFLLPISLAPCFSNIYFAGWEMHKVLFQNFDYSYLGGLFVSSIGTYFHTGTRISDVVLQNSDNVYEPIIFILIIILIKFRFYDLEDPRNREAFIQDEWSCSVLDLDGTLTGLKLFPTSLPPLSCFSFFSQKNLLKRTQVRRKRRR
jgi:hypothetical protein